MSVLRPFLAHLVDYAGLFPPAALPMERVVANYAAYLTGAHQWMLGRLIVPVSRLAELEAAAEAQAVLPRDPAGAWHLSALVTTADLPGDIRAIGEFNCRHAAEGAAAAVIDTIELKAATQAAIVAAKEHLPPWVEAFVEIPIGDDPTALVDELAQHGMRAKVRTGGVTADAFPSPLALARFLAECVRAGVPFKATAGLHHPLRNEYRLTYEPESARATMYGFVNVFLAAALLRAGGSVAEAVELLEERAPGAIDVGAEAVAWRSYRFDLAALRETRQLARSFGSCSFEEPVEDLQALDWYPRAPGAPGAAAS